MSRSGNRKSRRHQLQASHQKNWLIGRYSVLETLKAAVWPVQELFLSDTFDRDGEVEQLTKNVSCRVHSVTSDRLEQLCHSRHHQGIAARMGPYPYWTVEALISMASSSPVQPPLIVLCDRIQDTFNFGAILRCCDAMGVAGVVIGKKDQTGITPQVARSSSGAVNYVPVARTNDLSEACSLLRENGFQLMAASEKSESASWDQSLQSASVLVVGSEAHGISSELLQQCDTFLRIPMSGQVASLNAAVATGILLYEFRRQQTAGN